MLHRALQVLTGSLSGLAVVAVLFWTGVLTPGAEGPEGASASGFRPYPAPPLTLPGADGTPFDLAGLEGEVALVFFGFASCPDVCPLTLSSWTSALDRFRGTGREFAGVFVSVDPRRDTPEALGRWMQRFDPTIRALVGSEEEVSRTAADWGVFVGFRDAGTVDGVHAEHGGGAGTPGEGYLVDHSARTFVVDRRGRVVRILPPGLEPEALVETLAPLLGR
jgi:protein SCO1/2